MDSTLASIGTVLDEYDVPGIDHSYQGTWTIQSDEKNQGGIRRSQDLFRRWFTLPGHDAESWAGPSLSVMAPVRPPGFELTLLAQSAGQIMADQTGAPPPPA
jgi:hypothetical protein